MYRDMHVLRVQGQYDDAHRIAVELKRQVDAVLQEDPGAGQL